MTQGSRQLTNIMSPSPDDIVAVRLEDSTVTSLADENRSISALSGRKSEEGKNSVLEPTSWDAHVEDRSAFGAVTVSQMYIVALGRGVPQKDL